MLQGLRLLALFIVSMPTSIVAQVNVVAQPADDGPVVLMVDFDGSPLGDYTMAAFHSDWPDAEWVIGLGTGRAEIVDGAFAYSGRSLRLKYPAGTYGSRNQAIQARIDLPRKFEELYVSYRVRFENGFDFVKGGKLPGLIGGAGNVGGNRPNGSDGWSGRMMWRRGGDAVQYVYHPDQPGTYGEDFRWERRFEPGRWHTVEHRFVMNNPRIHDGILQAWFDGQEAQYVDDLRFRDVDSFAIDQFYISTFFGGGDITWAPAKDEYILFDDIIISTARIHLWKWQPEKGPLRPREKGPPGSAPSVHQSYFGTALRRRAPPAGNPLSRWFTVEPEHAAGRGVRRPRRSALALVCLEQHGRLPAPGGHRLHQLPAHA